MKVIKRIEVKEVILHLDEKIELDNWMDISDLQIYLGCGEIIDIEYIGGVVNDDLEGFTYEYRIKYMEL